VHILNAAQTLWTVPAFVIPLAVKTVGQKDVNIGSRGICCANSSTVNAMRRVNSCAVTGTVSTCTVWICGDL